MADITILITTKDRKNELGIALDSAITQKGDVEVLVIDDGSSDGTYDYVKEHYPTVRVVRYENNLGLIEQRNNGIKLANAPYVITIDDDAAFTSDDTAIMVREYFERNPQAGSLALPYIDVFTDSNLVIQTPPENDGIYVMGNYRGTAHADRKDLFLKYGGYRGIFYRQGEEGDLCTRMLNDGYYVHVIDTPPIKHMESPKRVKAMNMYYEMRNNILYTWYNVPFPHFMIHMPGTIFVTLKKHMKLLCLWSSIKGIFSGVHCILFRQLKERNPVSSSTYKAFRFLRHNGVVSLDVLKLKIEN